MRCSTATLLIALSLASTPAFAQRAPPLAESAWTDEHRALIATYGLGASPTNDVRTFLNHPGLVKGVMPFANYVVSHSTLPSRDRVILILRTAWLSRSSYLWAKHAGLAGGAGLSAEDVQRVGFGPQARGWNAFDTTLLRAADELHDASFIGADTWTALSARYDPQQLMDVVFTIAELSMLASTVNSVGVPVDARFTARLPETALRPRTRDRSHTPLTAPRILPLEPAQTTPAVRAMLDPSGSGRAIAAVYRTFAQHPALYAPRQILSEYIRINATLSPRVREMLILRIGYLCGSAYEWAAHARAGRSAGLSADEIRRIAEGPAAGWTPADATLLRAVDELYADDVIADATWAGLAGQFDRKQLLDILITAAGYRMVSMALNTFGVPPEPNSEPLPVLAQ